MCNILHIKAICVNKNDTNINKNTNIRHNSTKLNKNLTLSVFIQKLFLSLQRCFKKQTI